MYRVCQACCCIGIASVLLLSLSIGAPPGVPPKGPLSPRDEQATFHISRGFQVELVASEPDVIDPVSLAFDGDGRLFVAEMRGYPNEGVGTGTITSGRIKLLEDADGDGVYEKSTLYADRLRFPMGMLPYRDGLIVTVAPDILYLQDSDGDGRADRRRVLYTGFHLSNIQQMVNSPCWGLDNWVYAVAGSNGGTVRSAEKEGPAIVLRNRGVRFHPDVPGSLEPTSGGGQYGLTQDPWQHWFTATNSQHLRQIVLPDHYLQRNPYLPVRAVTINIPDHGAACKVYRLSPFEAWRVERTSRRAKSDQASRFSPTELVPGGFITSACSPIVYLADLFPAAYQGNVFVCDPANNLIHRDILEDNGVPFSAKRGDADHEFLASTDNWFRPVHLTLGPDGALYLCDFYREAIETPLSLPDDIKKELNLQSRNRGRIWRITVADEKKKADKPALRKAKSSELVAALESPNQWWRLTAQRLLVQRQDRAAVKDLIALARRAKGKPARVHALWTLHALKALPEELIELALSDPEPGVREQGLRLAEERLATSESLRRAVVARARDGSLRVRFQLALTLGEANTPETVQALTELARRDAGDVWIRTALLSSAGSCALDLLEALVRDRALQRRSQAGHAEVITRLAAMVGARGKEENLARVLNLLAEPEVSEAFQVALLDGLGERLRPLWDRPPAALQETVARARQLFDRAASTAGDVKRPLAERQAAVRLLARGPFAPIQRVAPALLTPRTPPALQLACVQALAPHVDDQVGPLLLQGWSGYSPVVRREVLEVLFARNDRLNHLVKALESKDVLPTQIEPARLEQLRNHRDPRLRARARKALTGYLAPERQKVLHSYESALDLKGEVKRGQGVFRKNCITCHRLEEVGMEVGPDLVAVLRNKNPEQLLTDLLDPSREVDPRYLNYLVETKKGRALTGMIAAETASSVTLRRGEKAEDVVLRSQIESIQATGKSVMPDGLEMQLSKQDVADLIAYLLAAGRKVP